MAEKTQTKIVMQSEYVTERKKMRVELKENARGRYVQVTETVNGRDNKVITPITGLSQLIKVLQQFEAFDSAEPFKAE